MSEKVCVSIVIPFYNSQIHIENCLKNLSKIVMSILTIIHVPIGK